MIMSRATVVMRDRLPADKDAQWWRMGFNATEEVIVTEDDPEKPSVVVTWEFPGGLDEDITPSSVAPQVSQNTHWLEDGKSLPDLKKAKKRNDAAVPEYFDVLMVGRPTGSPRWFELTGPWQSLASRLRRSAG